MKNPSIKKLHNRFSWESSERLFQINRSFLQSTQSFRGLDCSATSHSRTGESYCSYTDRFCPWKCSCDRISRSQLHLQIIWNRLPTDLNRFPFQEARFGFSIEIRNSIFSPLLGKLVFRRLVSRKKYTSAHIRTECLENCCGSNHAKKILCCVKKLIPPKRANL